MDSELCIEIYWVFPRLPFGIVAYAFTLFWTTLSKHLYFCGSPITVEIRKRSKLKVSLKLISTASICIFFVGLKIVHSMIGLCICD